MIYNHPPYTPEFNRIKLIFNKLKKEFKKLNHKNIYNDIQKCINKLYREDAVKVLIIV